MALTILKYFVIENHLLAVLTVHHICGAEILLTGCAPLRATTLAFPGPEARNGQVTVYECLLDFQVCEQIGVYVNAQLVSIFHLGHSVRVESGPDQPCDAGRARMIPWL